MAPAYTFCIPDEVHMKTQHAQRARLLILATALIVSYGYAASAYAANGTELSVIASVDNATPACSNYRYPRHHRCDSHLNGVYCAGIALYID